MVRISLGRCVEAKTAHLVLAIPVASGRTARHCDGFSAMSRVWCRLGVGGGERDGLESLCFLTESKFAAPCALPIRIPNPAARVQPGESGAVRVSSECTARTHCSANENSAHSVVGIRGCKEYFELETTASPSSDLPANDADIDTRSHLQLLSFTNTKPSQWPPRSPRPTPSPSAPRSVLPVGDVVVLFANRSNSLPSSSSRARLCWATGAP